MLVYLLVGLCLLSFIAFLNHSWKSKSKVKRKALQILSVIVITFYYYGCWIMFFIVHSDAYLDIWVLVLSWMFAYPGFVMLYFSVKNVMLNRKHLASHWSENTTVEDKAKAFRGWVWVFLAMFSSLHILFTLRVEGLIGLTIYLTLILLKEKFIKRNPQEES